MTRVSMYLGVENFGGEFASAQSPPFPGPKLGPFEAASRCNSLLRGRPFPPPFQPHTEKTIFPIPFKLNGYDHGDSFPFDFDSYI